MDDSGLLASVDEALTEGVPEPATAEIDWLASAACVAAGIAGATVATRRNTRRKRERELQDVVDALFADERDSFMDPDPDDDPLGWSLDSERPHPCWLEDLDEVHLIAA
jgi:hypothetical protein